MDPHLEQLLHAYHDDQLDAPTRKAFEVRLANDPSLREALNELTGVSAMLRSAGMPVEPAGAIEAWESVYRDTQERRIRKLSGWLSAAAALLAVSTVALSLRQSPAPTTTSTLSEIDVVMLASSGGIDESQSPTVLAAQWMAADLRVAQRSNRP
jgi:anti-sigma factor RsiW